MYGDNYKPNHKRRYEDNERFFMLSDSRDDMATRLFIILSDESNSKEDVHVAYKRSLLKRGFIKKG